MSLLQLQRKTFMLIGRIFFLIVEDKNLAESNLKRKIKCCHQSGLSKVAPHQNIVSASSVPGEELPEHITKCSLENHRGC